MQNQNCFNQLLDLVFGNLHRMSCDPSSLAHKYQDDDLFPCEQVAEEKIRTLAYIFS